jgi:SAM-dependent methyltransferase
MSAIHTAVIQRQYDEVIAAHYDSDPQELIANSLRNAVGQLLQEQVLAPQATKLKVFDLGMGTGRFIHELRTNGARKIQPYGLDLSSKMIALAHARIADLKAVVDDAANVQLHFPRESFDLIATHFITGFVPITVLGPKIWERLAPGGYWSFMGGTRAGFPQLQRKADSKLLRWLFGATRLNVDELVHNPAAADEVLHAVERSGFAIRRHETFMPKVRFDNLDEFFEFAYWGGWLTPFVEKLGLQDANAFVRLLLNTFFFPVEDHHSIEIVLAQKPVETMHARSPHHGSVHSQD